MSTKPNPVRRARSRGFRIESLESRELLAGDVLAAIVDGSLVIRGDRHSNDIVIRSVTAGGFIVEGRNQTTINGLTQGFSIPGTDIARDLDVIMGRGDDVVSITGLRVRNAIRLDGSKGSDRFELTDTNSVDFIMAGSRGDDVVVMTNVQTTGNADVRLGKGDDNIAAPTWTVGGRLTIDGQRGNDTFVFGALTVTTSAAIFTGRGQDQVAFIDDTKLPANTEFQMSKGDDVLLFNPSRGTGTATLAGRLFADLGSGSDIFALDSATTLASRIDVEGNRGDDNFSDATTTANIFKSISGIESRATANVTALANNALSTLERFGVSRSIFDNLKGAAPTVTLSSTTPLVFTENGTASTIDSGLTVADSDSSKLSGATVAITSGLQSGAGNDELSFTSVNGITGAFDKTTGILTFTGSATLADYQTVLRSVTFRSASENPSTTARVVTITVNDGTSTGQTTRTINVTAVNDAPVVSLADANLTFTENGAALPIDASLTVTDVDTTQLTGAVVTITSGFQSGTGNDVLAFTPVTGITGTFDATTGKLSFTGAASIADYQTVLRSVTFRTTSDNPSTTARVIRFEVNDGTTTGQDQRTVNLTAVDDPGILRIPAPFNNPAVVPDRPAGAAFTLDVNIDDPDTTGYVFQLDLDGSGIPSGVAQPTINSDTGVISWTPDASLVGQTFTIRVIAVSASGPVANQETFQVRIVAPT